MANEQTVPAGAAPLEPKARMAAYLQRRIAARTARPPEPQPEIIPPQPGPPAAQS
jgi:hypothetical protein